MKRFGNLLGSFGLACILLIFLFVLTLLGTLEQVEHGLFEVQKKYFDSLYLVHYFGPIPVPLPGAVLCMVLLFANLVVGGLIRIRKSSATVGVIVIHIGIVIMLAAGLVKLTLANEGALRLYEGEHSDEYESFHLWEVAIFDAQERENVEELLLSDEELSAATGGTGQTFVAEELPFDLTLRHFTENCVPAPKGPMWEAELPVVDGWSLRPLAREVEAERNIAGVFVEMREKQTGETREAMLWGFERFPWTFACGGRQWAVTLRHKRYSMPFEVHLDDFTKEEHPGTGIPRTFMSDITKRQEGHDQKLRIEMNEPLRHAGLVLFQSSWGPQGAGPNAPLFSVFAVVDNPSDYWPLYSCIVIGVGLIVAFGQKLSHYVHSQAKARAAAAELFEAAS